MGRKGRRRIPGWQPFIQLFDRSSKSCFALVLLFSYT